MTSLAYECNRGLARLQVLLHHEHAASLKSSDMLLRSMVAESGQSRS